jgi:hypothetical protein
MVPGGWKYTLALSLAWAGFAWGQTSEVSKTSEVWPSSKSDQPVDWHQSWDKPYSTPPEVPEDTKQPTTHHSPLTTHPTVPAKPVSRESTSVELPEMQINSNPSPHLSPNRGGTGGDVGWITFDPLEPGSPSPLGGEGGVRGNTESEWITWTRNAGYETADELSHDVHLIFQDYGNYFSWSGIGQIALGVAVAAPIANTSADLSFRNWYQRHQRDPWEESYAYSIKNAGEYTYALPAYFAIAIGGKAMQGLDSAIYDDGSVLGEVGGVASEWGGRCIRALAVGTPMVGALQIGLGSTRPGLGSSYWNPLNASHGVSGHAYVGSIPFLTAASMTDSVFLQVPLIAASCLTGWSRIQTDDHYLSQVALGWWMGYLAVRSVNRTQDEERAIEFLPGSSEGPGVSMLLRY